MAKTHMRRKEKEITDPAVIQEILQRGRYAVLSLCRGDEPYAVALSYGFDASRRALWFHCAREGLKLEFLRANAEACAVVVEDGGYRQGQCDHRYRSVVLRGPVTLVADPAEKRSGMEAMLAQLEDDPGPVRERTLKDDRGLEKTTVLRLDVRAWSAKQG